MMPAMGIYIMVYMAVVGRERWTTAILITAPLWIGMHLLFVNLLHVPWPPSLVGDGFPELRGMLKGLI